MATPDAIVPMSGRLLEREELLAALSGALSEVKAGRGTPHGGGYLSFQHCSAETLRGAFGPVIDRLAANGIDLTNSVENEHLCLELVAALGLPVAKSQIVDFAGRRVLAVEDTSTTGASVLTAVDALRDAGAVVAGVAVLVDRGARAAVTARGLEYRAAYGVGDLCLG